MRRHVALRFEDIERRLLTSAALEILLDREVLDEEASEAGTLDLTYLNLAMKRPSYSRYMPSKLNLAFSKAVMASLVLRFGYSLPRYRSPAHSHHWMWSGRGTK